MAEEISETSLNRFSEDKGPIHLTLVDPLVIEVAADVAWSGESFRHPSAGTGSRTSAHRDSLPTCNTLMTPRGGTLGVAELAAEGSQRGGPGRS